jgi:predicted dinucleotide-binding enzyme
MQNAHPIPQQKRSFTIAVIGVGTPAGSRLARSFALAGNRVQLSDADPDAAARVRGEILRADGGADAETLSCERTSCWEADIIVIAEYLPSRSRVIDRIRDVATGKIVLAAGRAAESAAQLRARLPHARIVSLADANVTLSSGDDEARTIVRQLLDAGERAARRRPTKAA